MKSGPDNDIKQQWISSSFHFHTIKLLNNNNPEFSTHKFPFEVVKLLRDTVAVLCPAVNNYHIALLSPPPFSTCGSAGYFILYTGVARRQSRYHQTTNTSNIYLRQRNVIKSQTVISQRGRRGHGGC